MSNVLVNTNLAAAAGVMAAVSVSRAILGRVDLLAVLNGALAGLVSITAGPDIVDHYWAIVIGAIGGIVCTGGIRIMEIFRLDDVVGAVPAHLFAGVWGTIAVCIAAGGNFVVQITGVLAVGAFVFVFSLLLWMALNKIMGARVSRAVEEMGPGRRGVGHRGLPRVCPDARSGKTCATRSDDFAERPGQARVRR